jgi:DNA-binding MarR family transcriptional regulator
MTHEDELRKDTRDFLDFLDSLGINKRNETLRILAFLYRNPGKTQSKIIQELGLSGTSHELILNLETQGLIIYIGSNAFLNAFSEALLEELKKVQDKRK